VKSEFQERHQLRYQLNRGIHFKDRWKCSCSATSTVAFCSVLFMVVQYVLYYFKVNHMQLSLDLANWLKGTDFQCPINSPSQIFRGSQSCSINLSCIWHSRYDEVPFILIYYCMKEERRYIHSQANIFSFWIKKLFASMINRSGNDTTDKFRKDLWVISRG